MNIVTNMWLWALTGRSSDFVDPELNSGVSFGVGCSEQAAAIRSILCLADTRTDFHVLGAMHAALSSKLFVDLPAAPLTCDCLASQSQVLPVTITGATAAPPAVKRWPVIRNRPTKLPAPTTFTVAFESAGVARVTDDTGSTRTVACRSSGALVIVDSLTDVGIDAAFVLDSGTWTTGDSFSVFCEPSRYPYAWVASQLTSRDIQAYIMQHASPLALENPSPFARVGAAALAVIVEQLRKTDGIPAVLTPDPVTSVTGPWTLVNNQLTLDGAGITLDSAPITYAE